jgi:hypothetical protein
VTKPRPSRPPRRGRRRRSRAGAAALALAVVGVGALALSAVIGRLSGPGDGERRADSLRAVARAGPVRVEVLNGSGQAGAGSVVAGRLRAAGIEVVGIRNADRFDYPRTLVVARGADAERARTVARRLHGSQLVRQRATAEWDVTVVVGRDQARQALDAP